MDRKGKGKLVVGKESVSGGSKRKGGVAFRDEGLKIGGKRKKAEVLQFGEISEEDFDMDDMEDEAEVETGGKDDKGIKSSSSYAFPKDEEMNKGEFDIIMEESYKPGSGFLRSADDDVKSSIEMDALTPTAHDPPIWQIKCAIGREKHSVLRLTHKVSELRKIGTKLQILSVFTVDHVKGFIFIEADKKHDILEACKGLNDIYATTGMGLLPKSEAPQLLTAQRKMKKYSEGIWAHVKSGQYKGDLAKVVAVSDRQGEAVIKLIPRIDILGLTQKDHDTGRSFLHDVELPKDGYLYKKVSLDSLSFCGVIPPEEEILQFALYNLICFSQKDFGLIVGPDEKGDGYKVLKEGSDGPVVVTVGKKEMMDGPFDSQFTALDLNNRQISINDVVKIFKGPSEGKHGVVKQIYRGVLFLYDESEQENGGYFCCKSEKVKLFAEEPIDKTGGGSSCGKQYRYGGGSYSFSQTGGSSSLGQQGRFGCSSYSFSETGGGSSWDKQSVSAFAGGLEDLYFTCRGSYLVSSCFDQLNSSICWAVALTRHLESLLRAAEVLEVGQHLSILELIRLTPWSAMGEDCEIWDLSAACEVLCRIGTVLEELAPLQFDEAGERVLFRRLNRYRRFPRSVPRYSASAYHIHELKDFMARFPYDGEQRFEQLLLETLRLTGPLSVGISFCSGYYYNRSGIDLYLPSRNALRRNARKKWPKSPSQHLMLAEGYGIDDFGRRYLEHQESYGDDAFDKAKLLLGDVLKEGTSISLDPLVIWEWAGLLVNGTNSFPTGELEWGQNRFRHLGRELTRRYQRLHYIFPLA